MTSRTRQLARPIGEILESMAHLFEREGQSEDPSHCLTGEITGQSLTADLRLSRPMSSVRSNGGHDRAASWVSKPRSTMRRSRAL